MGPENNVHLDRVEIGLFTTQDWWQRNLPNAKNPMKRTMQMSTIGPAIHLIAMIIK